MIIGKRALGGFKKIDIHMRGTASEPFGRYLASTNSARTLKEAKERYAAQSKSFTARDLSASYSSK